MNKEDIKKALECCITLKADSCKECPYGSTDCSSDKLQRDALDLITEQEQEIEKLKAENIRLTTKLGQVLLSIDTVKEMNAMCNIAEQIKQAKIDVLNKLKRQAEHCDQWNCEVVPTKYLDEMIEELQK